VHVSGVTGQVSNCSDVKGLCETSDVAAVSTVHMYSSHNSDDQLCQALMCFSRHTDDNEDDENDANDDDDDDDNGSADDDSVGNGDGRRLSSILSDCENSPLTSDGHVTCSRHMSSFTTSVMSPLPNRRRLSSSFRVSLNTDIMPVGFILLKCIRDVILLSHNCTCTRDGACGLVVAYQTSNFYVVSLNLTHFFRATFSKLLTYCVLRPT